jgi:hypothetical protein
MNKDVISTLTDCKSYLEYQMDNSDVDETVGYTIDEIQSYVLCSAQMVSPKLFDEVNKEMNGVREMKYFDSMAFKLIELIDTVQTAMLEA